MQWDQRLPHQVLVLTQDRFEVWKASSYAKEAGISTKDGLNKYLRRAQVGRATEQPAAMLILLDMARFLQSV